jgi:hypothetical protein
MLNLSFTFTGYLNGRPYWTSTQYGMQIVWNGIYWEILNWPYDGLPINYTDTNIPLTGWQLINNTSITATFTVNLGECCFEYLFDNNISGSTLIIEYTDCNYNPQVITAEFGTSGSFCATSIQYSNNTGSYSTSGSLCPPAPTPSITSTINVTPSITPSVTPSITATPSITISATPSATPSITPSTSPSASCLCYTLSNDPPPPPDPVLGATNFQYTDCSGIVIGPFAVFDGSPVDVCAQIGTVVRTGGDPGIITESVNNCCV